MISSYYLINPTDIDVCRQCAPSEGEANELFQVSVSSCGEKAIVQANWINSEAMNEIGTYLGDLKENGNAPQAVHDEVKSWNVIQE